MASVFGKVGSLFKDGTEAGTDAVKAAANAPDSNGNSPTNGGTALVNFLTKSHVVDKPFARRALHILP